MSKNITQTAVPKLRFPEFREAEGWKEKPLGKMLKIGNGKDYNEPVEKLHHIY